MLEASAGMFSKKKNFLPFMGKACRVKKAAPIYEAEMGSVIPTVVSIWYVLSFDDLM